MSPNHRPVSDEQLDLHIAALRDDDSPATAGGPSPQVVDATLAMLKRSDESEPPGTSAGVVTGRRPFYERIVAMTLTQRIAAVLTFALGTVVLYTVFMMFNALAPSVAFADVAEKLKGARTLQFNSTVALVGQPPQTVKTLIADADRIRTEMPGGGASVRRGNVTLVLEPKTRTAIRLEMKDAPKPNPENDVAAALRSLGNVNGEKVGEKQIDGVDVTGFKTVNGPMRMTVWADKKTSLPVRIEMTMPVGGGDASVVLDKFVLDAPLDDALFSLDVPAGYQLKSRTIEMPKLGKLEEEVARLLKWYADASGGAFPPSLVDWAAFNKVTAQGPADPQAVARLGALFGQLFSQKNGYGYDGNGVKLGEKDKIVFWYKPDGSETYRAVYGDLRIEDVAADKVPTTKPAAP